MYGKKFKIVLLLTCLMAFTAGQAYAIPAFSRQHKAECTTCHTIYPELNEYGEAFLKNSYLYSHQKQPDSAPAPKPAQAKAVMGGGGDPALMERLRVQAEGNGAAKEESAGQPKKSEGLWLAGIPEQLPLSMTATLTGTYNKDAADNNKFDTSARALALQAGGSFRESAGFFAKYTLYSEGTYNPGNGNALIGNPNVPKNNGSELSEMFLSWRHAFNSPLNIRVGRMRPKLSLWKSSNKISVSSFASQTYTVGASPFTIDSPEDAIEANAAFKRVYLAAGMVDRNGQKYKEGYGHISVKLGGADFLGNEPEMDLDKDSIWDYLSITLAGYGYGGRNANTVGGIAENFNDYYRVGGDIDINYKKFRARGSVVNGRDTNPYFMPAKNSIYSSAISTELEYMIDTNLMAAFRYEYIYDQFRIWERNVYIPYIAYSPIQNIRMVLEYRQEEYVQQGIPEPKIANVGISFSF
jgi:hypothetical protein